MDALEPKRREPKRRELGRSELRVAALAWVLFVGISLLLPDRVPFAFFPAFAFPRFHGPMVMPLVRAEGEVADPRALSDFVGIEPADVDVEHEGYGSSAAHQFVELRQWIETHQAADPGAESAQRVDVEIGVWIFEIGADGELAISSRIDARGRARRR